MVFHFHIITVILVTTMALPRGVDTCDHCDPDVPSRPLPRSFVRLKRTTSENCAAGEFFNVTGKFCQECAPGTYITKKMANEGVHHSCVLCQKADKDLNQKLMESCNKTRDTVIHCRPGYYMQQLTNRTSVACDCVFQCTPCSICGIGDNLHLTNIVEPCYNYTDTVCCRHANMVVSNGECVTPTTRTQGTTQQQRRGDTVETPSTSGPNTTHQTHHRNDFQVMLAYPPLVFTSFLLQFLIRFSS